MKHALLVFLGGGIGSVSRYLISKSLASYGGSIPLGTFSVNIIGSLLIGIILGISLKSQTLSENTVLLLATGFCGGFTTFSSFAYEQQVLLKNGDFLYFSIYAIGSFTLGILAVLLGITLSK